MRPTEPQMPKTPEEWRRWLLKQASSDLGKIEGIIKDAKAELKAGCIPPRQRFLSKEVSELQRIKNALKRQIKRLGG
jgi:hypothetical protein